MRAYDVSAESARAYAAEMGDAGIDVEIVDEPREAVEGCDVVVTAGPILREPHATIRAGWLRPGALAVPLDFDSYWHPEAWHEADGFFTDDTAQLRYYQQVGYFADIPPVRADLGEVLAGLAPGRARGREGDGARIVCCNLGLAIEDVATAALVYRNARAAGVGTWLPL